LALRARIVLHCAEGLTNTEVATRLDVARPTVGKWRQRFVRHRLGGLQDEPRPGVPRSITDDHVAKVVTLTLESKPKNATHWSTRSMAERSGLSQTAISRIWRAFGLQPHRESTFKISEDPQFVDKVRDVVDLPPEPSPLSARESPGGANQGKAGDATMKEVHGGVDHREAPGGRG
jgi:transposase